MDDQVRHGADGAEWSTLGPYHYLEGYSPDFVKNVLHPLLQPRLEPALALPA